MQIRIRHANGLNELIQQPQLVVVEDDHGNPVAVAGKLGMREDDFLVSSIDSPEFNASLRLLGIDKTVIVTNPFAKLQTKGPVISG